MAPDPRPSAWTAPRRLLRRATPAADEPGLGVLSDDAVVGGRPGTAIADVPPPAGLPPGRDLDLPGRGTTWIHEHPGPPGTSPGSRSDLPGVPLLLLHGWTVTGGVNWYPAFAELGRHHRTVALDHRGHGRGVRSSRFRLEDCADDAVAVADRLGIDRFVAVGYSMGGPIAQLAWHRHRDRVAGLVLCATSRNFRGRPVERAFFPLLGGLAVAVRAAPPGVRSRLGHRMAVERFDDTPVGRWAMSEVRRNDPRLVVEAGHAIGRFSSADWIGDVEVPTAVLVTEHDAIVPPHRQRKLARAIHGADVYPVAGDHGVCVLRPQAFVPVLATACRAVSDEAVARARVLGR